MERLPKFPKPWAGPVAAFLPLLVVVAAQIADRLASPVNSLQGAAASFRAVGYATLAAGIVCAVLLIPFLWAIGRGKRVPTFLPVGIAALPSVAAMFFTERTLRVFPVLLGVLDGPPQARTLFIAHLVKARAWVGVGSIVLLLSVAFALLICAAARTPRGSRLGLAAGLPALLALGVVSGLSTHGSREASVFLIFPVVAFALVAALAGSLTGEDEQGTSTGPLTLAATFSAGAALFLGVDGFRTTWVSSLLLSDLTSAPSARLGGLQHAFARLGQMRSAAFEGLFLTGLTGVVVVAIAARSAGRRPSTEPADLEITAKGVGGRMGWTGPLVTLATCVAVALLGWHALASELSPPSEGAAPLVEKLELPVVSGKLKAMGYPPSVAATSTRMVFRKGRASVDVGSGTIGRFFTELKRVRGSKTGVLSGAAGWGKNTLVIAADRSAEAARLDALAGAAQQVGYSRLAFVVLPPEGARLAHLEVPKLLRPISGALLDAREKVLIGLPSSKDAPLGVGSAWATVDSTGRIQEFDSAGQPTAAKGPVWLFADPGVKVETLLRAAVSLRERGNPPSFLPLVKPGIVTREAIAQAVTGPYVPEVLHCAMGAVRHREHASIASVSLEVTASGTVSKVDLAGATAPTPWFARCLRSKLKLWRFPRARALHTERLPLGTSGSAPAK